MQPATWMHLSHIRRPSAQALVDAPANAPAVDPTAKGEAPARGAPAYCELPAQKVSPNAWTQRVPTAVVSALLDKGPMLVVGDAPGDPDCFCSAVAVARAREALGLPAAAHVDAPAPKQIQGLLRDGEMLDAAGVAAQAPKTVLFVDNDGTRVGDAATQAMRAASRVVVVDHHDVDPTHASLGLDPEKTELVVWKDTGADAAALMALAAILRAVDASDVTLFQGTWKTVLEPLVGAMYSDTRGFEAARTRPATLGLLHTVLDTKAVDLKATLQGFGGGIPAAQRKAVEGAVTERAVEISGKTFGQFALDGATVLDAWMQAREHSPELTWSDMLFGALDHVEARIREQDYDVALFAIGAKDQAAMERLDEASLAQLPPRATKFSVRTQDGDLAPRLAGALGGGGKPHEGGGITDVSPAELVAKAEAYLTKQAELSAHANLRNLGGV